MDNVRHARVRTSRCKVTPPHTHTHTHIHTQYQLSIHSTPRRYMLLCSPLELNQSVFVPSE